MGEERKERGKRGGREKRGEREKKEGEVEGKVPRPML
jgi:hypothetical protein